MKSIIFVLLIYYSFCQLELKKFGKVTISSISYPGLVYLNTEDYHVGDSIYIQLNAVNGYISSRINYQFYNSIPDSAFIPSKSIDHSSHGSSETNILGKRTFTEKYYYNIKKDENGKYLIIRYPRLYLYYSGAYLEVEHNKVNWTTIIFIIVFGVIGLSIIIVIIVIIIIKFKKKKVAYYQPLQPSYNPPSTPPQYNQPSQPYSNNSGYDSTTFNNNPQQQNIYYDPQQKSINY